MSALQKAVRRGRREDLALSAAATLLRAGFATSATRAGVSTFKIRQQTGHASDAMLSRYVRGRTLPRERRRSSSLKSAVSPKEP